MGSHSLFYITTGNYNSGLGEYAGPAAGNGAFINTTAIGYNSTPSASNRITLGTVANNNLTGGYGTWQNLSDARFKRNVSENVPGLAFITRLRPVTYTMDAEGVDRFLGIAQRMDTIPDGEAREQYRTRLHEVSNATLTGFLAQEVEQAAKEVGYVFDGVHHPVDEHDHYTLGYASFTVPLVKAVQELNATVQEQQALIEAQQRMIEGLIERIETLETIPQR